MKKLAVITIAVEDYFQRMAKFTHPLMQRYADKIGADFIAITERKISETTPHWEKFQFIDYLNRYDRMIYLDTDVIVRNGCPNLFDIVPETHFGIFNESPFTPDREYALLRTAELYEQRDFKWDGKYYNSGVMVFSKQHRHLFRKPSKEISNYFEQSYLNLALHRLKPQIFELDYKFNRMTCMDKFTGQHRYESYIIHYAGIGYTDNTLNIIQKDWEIIKNLPDDFKSPKQVWLVMQGDLGEQVQAEPTIRFALRHVWPGSDMRISTSFPELFSHLPIICKKPDENPWEGTNAGEPFTRTTLPGPESIHGIVVNSLMCHLVDYSSMAVLSRTLPDVDKTCRLLIDPDAIRSVLEISGRSDFTDCVLIHAGSGFASKTFPTPWWQAVVDGVIADNLTPVLIGQDTQEEGVLKLDGRGKAIDLTNALSSQEFIAAISLVPILVSNDSTSLPVAGAFDHWIIVIPTCKHPDHILPYRHGTKSYRTAALYKRLAFDDIYSSRPEMAELSVDRLKGEWTDYLPDSQTVLDQIRSFHFESIK